MWRLPGRASAPADRPLADVDNSPTERNTVDGSGAASDTAIRSVAPFLSAGSPTDSRPRGMWSRSRSTPAPTTPARRKSLPPYSGGGGMAATTSFRSDSPVRVRGERRGAIWRGASGAVRRLADVTAACSRRVQNVCSYLRRSGSDRAGAGSCSSVIDLESGSTFSRRAAASPLPPESTPPLSLIS